MSCRGSFRFEKPDKVFPCVTPSGTLATVSVSVEAVSVVTRCRSWVARTLVQPRQLPHSPCPRDGDARGLGVRGSEPRRRTPIPQQAENELGKEREQLADLESRFKVRNSSAFAASRALDPRTLARCVVTSPRLRYDQGRSGSQPLVFWLQTLVPQERLPIELCHSPRPLGFSGASGPARSARRRGPCCGHR